MTTHARSSGFFLILALAGILLLWHSFDPSYESSAGSASAMMFFPRVVLALWILLALAGAVEAFRKGMEAEKWALGRLAAFMAIVVAYVALIPQLGFLIASVPCAFLSLAVFGFRNPVLLPLASVVLPVSVWALFTYVIQIGLPASPWFVTI